MSDATRQKPKRLRVLMRDFRMLEAGISLPESQSLTSFLAGRKDYLVLHDAHWLASGERQDHVTLRVDRILWLAPNDDALLLTNSRVTTEPRSVEMQLERGLQIRAGLTLGQLQRIADYLEFAGPFVPLHSAVLTRGGRPSEVLDLRVGDVAVNQQAIQGAWELSVETDDDSVISEERTDEDTQEIEDQWGGEAPGLDWEHDDDEIPLQAEVETPLPAVVDPIFGIGGDDISTSEDEPDEAPETIAPRGEGWV